MRLSSNPSNCCVTVEVRTPAAQTIRSALISSPSLVISVFGWASVIIVFNFTLAPISCNSSNTAADKFSGRAGNKRGPASTKVTCKQELSILP